MPLYSTVQVHRGDIRQLGLHPAGQCDRQDFLPQNSGRGPEHHQVGASSPLHHHHHPIIAIIRSANSIGARVRASATRHTFNPWLWGVESNVQPGTQVCCHTVMCHVLIVSFCDMLCHVSRSWQGQNTDYIIAMLPLSVSDRFAYHRY